jgi:hypothetical protein
MTAFVLGLMLALPGVASAAPPAPKDFVLGKGQIIGDNTFYVGALSDGNGANPRGFVFIRDPDQYFLGRVICLNVSGNRATILADIVRQQGRPDLNGGGVWVRVKDNGRNGNPVPDEFSNWTYPAAAWQARRPLGCLPPSDPNAPIISGDVKVADDYTFGWPNSSELSFGS